MSNSIQTSKAAALAAAKAAALQAKVQAKSAQQAATAAQQQVALAQHDAVQEAAKKAEAEMAARKALNVTTAAPSQEENKMSDTKKAEKAAKKAEKAKAAAEKKAQVQALKDAIKALKANGAAMTDADKAKVKSLRGELKTVKGAVGGKAKVVKLVAKAIAALDAASAEFHKYTMGTTPAAALVSAGSAVAALKVEVEQSEFKKVVKTTVAKAKTAKPQVAVNSLVILRENARAAYEDILDDVTGEFRVVKVSEKKAVVAAADGSRCILPLAHLKPVA